LTEGGVLARSDRPGTIELSAVRYRVIRRLVGELSFRVVARCSVLIRQASWFLLVLATIFPILFEAWAMPHGVEYVADVAELEMLQHKARYAQPVRPLAALALASLQVERLSGLRAVLHPAVCLVQSRFSIVTAWENNQTNDGGRHG
jgi:hypothetical protein